MDRREFLNMVFSFFNVKDEEQTLYKSYDLALSKINNVDWDRLYIKTLENVSSRYLPAPKFFLDLMPTCIKREFRNVANEGNHIRVIFESGRYTDFVICGFGITLPQIKEKSLKNDNVKEVRMYPKQVEVNGDLVNVALIGNTVYPETTPHEVVYAKS